MEKFFQLMLIAFAAIYLTACQKNITKNELTPEEIVTASAAAKPAPAPVRVKTKTRGADIRTYTYTTDGQLLQSASTVDNTIMNAYGPNTIVTSIFYPDGTLAGASTHEVSGIGLIKKTIAEDLTGYYTYNLYNQVLTHDVYFTDGTIIKGNFYYANGNLDSVVAKKNGLPYWKKTYTYHNKANVLGNEVFGEAYAGAGSKNLIKSMVYSVSNGATTTETYIYKISQGKVTIVETIKNGVQQPDTFYTYQ